MRPAGVRGDVAADLRLLGGTGIRRKEQAALSCDATHVRGRDAGLDLHAPDQRIERAHTRKPLEGDDDAAVERNSAARITRTAAARDDGHAVGVAPGDHLGGFLRGLRPGDRVCPSPQAARLGLVREVLSCRSDNLGGHGGALPRVSGAWPGPLPSVPATEARG